MPVGFKWFADGLCNGTLVFGGEESAGATFVRKDPVTGAIASEAAAASEADVAKVVEAANRAFAAWSETGPGERRAPS